MQLRWCNNIQISLIIPTRGRLELLHKCIESFISTASRTIAFEFIIIIDHDDLEMHEAMFMLTANNPKIRVRYISTNRSFSMQRDYNNLGANASSGELLFILNDDVEMTTKYWDRIIYDRYLQVKTYDDIHMLSVLDDTHKGDERGCCFPIVTKTYSNLFNGVFPSDILMWSADIVLNKIFKSINRIEYIDDVLLKHVSVHTESRDEDEINLHVQRVSKMQHSYNMKYGKTDINDIIRFLKMYLSANTKPKRTQRVKV